MTAAVRKKRAILFLHALQVDKWINSWCLLLFWQNHFFIFQFETDLFVYVEAELKNDGNE